MTEWSKVLRSGRSVFARVGSSPTACIFTLKCSVSIFFRYIYIYIYNKAQIIIYYIGMSIVLLYGMIIA